MRPAIPEVTLKGSNLQYFACLVARNPRSDSHLIVQAAGAKGTIFFRKNPHKKWGFLKKTTILYTSSYIKVRHLPSHRYVWVVVRGPLDPPNSVISLERRHASSLISSHAHPLVESESGHKGFAFLVCVPFCNLKPSHTHQQCLCECGLHLGQSCCRLSSCGASDPGIVSYNSVLVHICTLVDSVALHSRWRQRGGRLEH
jgi:hypothetical protein